MSDDAPSHTAAADAGWTDSATASHALHHRQMTQSKPFNVQTRMMLTTNKNPNVMSDQARLLILQRRNWKQATERLCLAAVITGASRGGSLER